jgi:hypothetical protein
MKVYKKQVSGPAFKEGATKKSGIPKLQFMD